VPDPHEAIRLEKNGVIVAYLAPNFEVRPTAKNAIIAIDRPRDNPTLARDLRIWRHEVVVQGHFQDSDTLPAAHRADLEALFGGAASARQQVNRVLQYAFITGGPFEFYDDGDEYTQTTMAGINYALGQFPVVQVDEIQVPRVSGLATRPFVLKLIVGVERSG
jgi:hypothetical protein